MIKTESITSLEGPWKHGGITVTCVRAAPSEAVECFWPLYEEAFGPLRIRAVARQVLRFDEFADEMTDERIWKYIAFDEHHHMVGLTTLTDDISVVPWVSAEYFAHHYPEQWARNAVFYLGMSLVKSTMRHAPVFLAMLRPALSRVASRQGICGYDVCGYNDSSMSLGDAAERLLHRLADVEVAPVDVQTYYTARITGTLKGA